MLKYVTDVLVFSVFRNKSIYVGRDLVGTTNSLLPYLFILEKRLSFWVKMEVIRTIGSKIIHRLCKGT